MSALQCNKDGCTVVDTGKCLLSHAELADCPHYIQADLTTSTQDDEATSEQESPSPFERQVEAEKSRAFHSGLELGISDILKLTRSSYHHIIGLLGFFDAGKTCFLSSLYLGVSCRQYRDKYLFAGSLTTQGFEQRARQLREWDAEGLPDRLSDHTILTDPRRPAFLHLSLKERTGSKRRLNLLLSDLPGEWCSDLVHDAGAAQRFDFLKRADGIVFIVEGPRLANPAIRQNEIHRAKLLFERLVHDVAIDPATPFVLAISKVDLLEEFPKVEVNAILRHARSLGMSPRMERLAAFSTKPQTTPNGYGIPQILDHVLDGISQQIKSVLGTAAQTERGRAFLEYRW